MTPSAVDLRNGTETETNESPTGFVTWLRQLATLDDLVDCVERASEAGGYYLAGIGVREIHRRVESRVEVA